MSQHIVNRTPSTGRFGADSANIRDDDTVGGGGRFIVTLLLILSIVAGVGGWGYWSFETFHDLTDVRDRLHRTISERDDSQNRANLLTGQLRDRDTKLRTVGAALKQTTEERDAHGRTIESLNARLSDQADENRRTRLQFYQSLHEFGATAIADPRLARHVLTHAVEVAQEVGADALPSNKLLSGLPEPSAIRTPVSIRVVSISRTGPETVVDVEITDPASSFLAGLHRGDFEIYDEQHRLHAVAVHESAMAGESQDILLLLDQSDSTKGPPIQALQSAATAFVDSIANPARIQVVAFSDDMTPLSPRSTDSELHKQAIARLTPKGGTAMYRTIIWSAKELASRKPPRFLVLFTDGNDSRNQETIEQAIAACRAHDIPVHVVALVGRDTNEKILRRLATETTGMYLPVTDPAQLTKRFQEVARSLQRPIYRIRLLEAFDPTTLTLQVGRGQPVAIHTNGIAQPSTLPHVLPTDKH